MRGILILGAALALAACQKEAAKPPPTPASAEASEPPAGMDISLPLLARGNEPFWALKIEGTAFTLSRPGEPDAAFTAPGAMVIPGKASWTAKAADGRVLTATLFVSECSDGMSDLRYPMTAEVELGGQTLRGCAAKMSELPKESGAGG